MYLFFDTETTGFPSLSKNPLDPKQGRVCQLGVLLTDENARTLAEFSTLIRQDDHVEMAQGAYDAHGWSLEECKKYGVKSRMALQTFRILARKCNLIVAHNIDFDWKALLVECNAHNLEPPLKEIFCTMKSSTNICKLPGRGSSYKWPKLEEALKFFCDRDLGDAAHDAMEDTRACRDVFFAMKEQGHITV